jgi:hypothetical protein
MELVLLPCDQASDGQQDNFGLFAVNRIWASLSLCLLCNNRGNGWERGLLDGGLDRCERTKWWMSCPMLAWTRWENVLVAV